MDSRLTCSSCENHMDYDPNGKHVPKLLGCIHTICISCAKDLYEQTKIVCPICNVATNCRPQQLPTNFARVRELQTEAFKANKFNCIDCDQPANYFCRGCKFFLCMGHFEQHQSSNRFKNHILDQVSRLPTLPLPKNLMLCPNSDHEDEGIEFFCESCQELGCNKCHMFLHKDATHKLSALPEAREKCAQLITDEMKKQDEKRDMLSDGIAAVNQVMADVTTNAATTKQSVIRRAAVLIKEIEERRDFLVKAIDDAEKSKNGNLGKQLQSLLSLQDNVERAYQFIRRDIEANHPGSELQILSTHKTVKNRLATLCETIRPIEPVEKNNLRLLENGEFENMRKLNSSWGSVTTSSPYGPNCTCSQIESIMMGVETVVTINYFDENNDSIISRDLKPEVKLKYLSGSEVQVIPSEDEEGHHTISFTPNESGPMIMRIHVNGQPIRGSPFRFTAEHFESKEYNDNPGNYGQQQHDPYYLPPKSEKYASEPEPEPEVKNPDPVQPVPPVPTFGQCHPELTITDGRLLQKNEGTDLKFRSSISSAPVDSFTLRIVKRTSVIMVGFMEEREYNANNANHAKKKGVAKNFFMLNCATGAFKNGRDTSSVDLSPLSDGDIIKMEIVGDVIRASINYGDFVDVFRNVPTPLSVVVDIAQAGDAVEFVE